MIQVDWSVEDISMYQNASLPEGAVRIDTPMGQGEMMRRSAPIQAVLCFALFLAMLGKTLVSHRVVIHPAMIGVGFLVGFALLPLHEYLHALVYPRDAVVTVGRLRGGITFVALASYPLRRARFILMSLFPLVLGILPLGLFLVSPPAWRGWNGFLFGMACMGMVSPSPDVLNVITVLRMAGRRDAILFYKEDMYRIPG